MNDEEIINEAMDEDIIGKQVDVEKDEKLRDILEGPFHTAVDGGPPEEPRP